jgi:hypothetical protein
MRALVSAALALVLSGCTLLDNIGPQNRLSDQVHILNDEVRWGRIDLAAQRVAPAHRRAFVAQHRAWGRAVRIADADVSNLEMNLPDGRSASIVTYSWVDEATMELFTTSVRQLWVGEGEGFLLLSEEIVGGQPTLLPGAPTAPDPEAAPEDADALPTAGGEAVAAPSAETTTTTAAPPSPRRRDAQGVVLP